MTGNFKLVRDILPEVIKNIESESSSSLNRTYYNTLDDIIGGCNNGELITIAGERNNYSNLLMQNIGKKCLLKSRKPIILLDFGIPDENDELIDIIKISKDSKYDKISLFEPIEVVFEKIQNFAKIHEDCVVLISGLEQVFCDYRARFELKDKLDPFAINLKRLARKNDLPIIISLNLPISPRYNPDEYVELYDLGIFDAFSCYSDKVLTTKVFAYDEQDSHRDLDIRIVKNKNGRTGTLYFKLCSKNQSIIEHDYCETNRKTSVAF